MANRAHLLEARVRQLDAAGQRILEQVDAVHMPSHFLNSGDHFSLDSTTSEEGVFTNNNIDHGVFIETLSLVSNIPGDLPAKLGAIGSLIECLVFLYIQLCEGVEDRIDLLRGFFRWRRPAVGHLLPTGWRGFP